MKRALGIVGVLGLWEIVARAMGHALFPPLSRVLPSMWGVRRDLVSGTYMSLQHLTIGYAMALVLGTVMGIIVAEYAVARMAVMPVVDLMRPIAAMTLFPLLIIMLGLGLWSKAFVIFWTSWPAIVLNTIQGLDDVDGEVQEAGKLDGCGRWALLRYIRFPLSMPVYMTGLRIGLSGGWISVVAADMLGGSSGLGYCILKFSQTFRFPEMYGSILTIATVGLAANVGMALLQRTVEGWIGERGTETGHMTDSRGLRFHDRAMSFGIDGFKFRGGEDDG